MSDKLEKLTGVEWQELILGDDKPKLVTNIGARQIMQALNAAIDHVGQLEAENKELRSLWSQSEDREVALKVRLDELEARYEGHIREKHNANDET